jgi:hypothetical protein
MSALRPTPTFTFIRGYTVPFNETGVMVRVPQDFVVPGNDKDDLIQKVLWEAALALFGPGVSALAILTTTTNANVDLINLKVM